MSDNTKDIVIKYRFLSSDYLAKCEECKRFRISNEILEGQVEAAAENRVAIVRPL